MSATNADALTNRGQGDETRTGVDQRTAENSTRSLADRVESARGWLQEFHGRDDADGSVRLALQGSGGAWDELQAMRPGRSPFTESTREQMLDVLAPSFVAAADAGNDVFCSPYLHEGARRAGGATARRHCHADIDGALDLSKVRQLGGLAVASGSIDAAGDPHGHVYVRLSASVPADHHTGLCRALGQFVGGGLWDSSKCADNDVLRPAGTLNLKHGHARLVSWLIEPDDPSIRTWTPSDLATELGMEWPPATPAPVETTADDGEVDDTTTTPRSVGSSGASWAEAGIAGELDKLRQLPRPWREGASFWDRTMVRTARRLVELSNALGNLEEVHERFLEAAPFNSQWDKRDAKWAAALTFIGDRCAELPDSLQGLSVEIVPLDRDDLTLTKTTTEIGSGASEIVDDRPAKQSDAGLIDDDKLARWPLLDLAALVDPDRPERRWLWGDLVPEGDHVSLVAPSGEGKSLLALALVLALLRGRHEFIGRPLNFSGRVLYVDLENSEDDWSERLRDLGITPANVCQLNGKLLVLHMPQLNGLDTVAGAAELAQALDTHGIGAGDLLVLDSTQRVTVGDENSNDTMRRLYLGAVLPLKRRGVTVIRTDNTGWNKSRERCE